MMQELNQKFASYGIIFEQCNVTNVNVSPSLISALQEKTRLKFELKNHEKEQENKKLTLENEEQQKLTNLQRNNERIMYELEQNIVRAKVDKEQDEVQANTKKEVGKVKAEEKASVMVTHAEGDQRIIKNDVQSMMIPLVNKARTDAQRLKISTDKDAKMMEITATTELEQAKAKYEALIQECQAEAENLNAINAQRQHNFEMNKAQAYEAMSSGSRTKMVMSGSAGESLIKKLFDTE